WRASWGSRSTRSSIDPLRSAKSTVTCLRSPSRPALELSMVSARCPGVYVAGTSKRLACSRGRSTGCAQMTQNFAAAMSGAPQLAQREGSGVAASRQNRASGGFAVRQRGQVIDIVTSSAKSIDLTKKSGSVQWTPPDWGATIVCDNNTRIGWRRSNESQRHEKQVGAEHDRCNRRDRVGGPL